MIKKIKSSFSAIVLILFSFSCVQLEESKSTKKEDSLREYSVQAVLWQQRSAEHRALCYQAYNTAIERLKDIDLSKSEYGDKPVAIVSDLDETVIDNSYYNAKLIEENREYEKETWKEWVLKENAKALPGAVDFFNKVRDMGIEVFYISNRRSSEKNSTINNLKKLGLPFADSTHIMLKTTESEKQKRRNKVLDKYEVLLYLGDNLSDFNELYDNKGTLARNNITDSLKSKFGRHYIVFPNIMYGDWESKGIYNSNYNLSTKEKDSIRKSNLISY